MFTPLVLTFCVSWVEGVSLACIDELLLCKNLIRVMTATCTSDSKAIVIDVKDEVVLSHESSSKSEISSFRNVHGHTISVCLLSVEILAWVPVEIKSLCGLRLYKKTENGK